MGAIKTLALKLFLSNLPALRTYAVAVLPMLLEAAKERLRAAEAEISKASPLSSAERIKELGIAIGLAILQDAGAAAAIEATLEHLLTQRDATPALPAK